jgi:hypothetical protein
MLFSQIYFAILLTALRTLTFIWSWFDMITLSEINTAYRNGTYEERQEFIELIIPDLFENPVFKNYFDNMLLTSELKPIKRISTTETMLGLNDFADEDVPTIPEQIKELANRIEQPLNKVTETVEIEVPVIPSTTLEHKAMKLVERLKVKPRSRTGEVFLDNTELTKFLTTELPEELRSNDSNLRRVKKRVIEKAKSRFPNAISINKSKYGRHETRIIFKESYQANRNGTLV